MLIMFVQVFANSKFCLEFENHFKTKIKIQAFVRFYQFKGNFKLKLTNFQLLENVKRPYI